MADLQGPKFRIGTFEEPSVFLETGQFFMLDANPSLGDANRIHLPHPDLLSALQPSDFVFIRDGLIRLQVQSQTRDSVQTLVRVGGWISHHQGVNVPGLCLDIPSITDKDLRDLQFAANLGVDWVALSFVQSPQDVMDLRHHMNGLGALKTRICAKIEKPKALECLEAIMEIADGVLIARGDLGIEVPPEEVPVLQKKIIRLGRAHQKPVIVATQMLESMTHAPIPTRAEASDVATAIYDGVDGVMLSAESATGKYPIESVQMMDQIIQHVEKDALYRSNLDQFTPLPHDTIADAMTIAARSIVSTIPIAAIVSFTQSGRTAFQAASQRPNCPIIAMTASHETARTLSLIWGVYAIVAPSPLRHIKDLIHIARSVVLQHRFASHSEERIVMTAGLPLDPASSQTNLIWVESVGQNA
jgi:pyruvate kinase